MTLSADNSTAHIACGGGAGCGGCALSELQLALTPNNSCASKPCANGGYCVQISSTR